jgi:dolichol-phosphate mannosyltransferase/undecaprenyl-phosphate 4-deoxy-4-formamido-L-arabinose transferase
VSQPVSQPELTPVAPPEATEPVAVSIVVPCYRSGEWLPDLVARVVATMDGTKSSFEVILVNDASPDTATWPAIEGLATQHPEVRGIDLLGNVGQFRSTLCGFEAARGQVVVTIDDDLQNPPEEIPKLLDALDAGAGLEVVIGSYERKQHSWFRNLGTRLHAAVNARLYGKPKDLELTSFRALRRPVVDALLQHRTVKPIIGPLILQSTRRIANVPVAHEQRPSGSSGWRLGRLVGTVVDNVVNTSTAPLRLVSLTGLLIAAGSAVLGVYYLVRSLAGNITVPGFTTLAIMVVFFGGSTLATIGLLGEYVVRIVTEVTGAPRYVVRRTVG